MEKERPFFSIKRRHDMQKFLRWSWYASLTTLVAMGIAACGGNDNLPPKATISKVYVMGDSLADVGTFGGVKFTVQDPVKPSNSLIWPQLIANHFGLDGGAQCNFYAFTGTTFAPNPTAGCTNYAIGGGRVRVKDADGGALNPLTVGTQMAARALAGDYNSNDLVLIVGGGNDAADLTTAVLQAGADPTNAGGKITELQTFLTQQLTLLQTGQLLSADPSGAAAGNAYMTALANTLFTDVKTKVLDKKATHVAILNMPDITITPLLQATLGTMSPLQASQVQALVRTWISTFNTQLKTNIANDSRIALVDFYTDFQDEVSKPADYGLANATTPVCTVDKSVALGKFPCLSTELDALPGKTAGWWKTHAFSDGFHPTPFGHSLLAASVSRALARAGWL
jgi:phospholipase/lecithinase/hemolysin